MDKKELIKKTIDVPYYKRHTRARIIVLPLILLAAPMTYQNLFPLFVFLMLLVLHTANLVYDIHKLISLQRDPDSYEICMAMVLDSKGAVLFDPGEMYLEIVLTDGDGHRVCLKTNSVFASRDIGYRYYADFLHTYISVLYDRKSGRVLVIDNSET